MKKTVQDILKMIEENNVQMIDFKMVDINGQYRHVTIPAKNFNEDLMKYGVGFDASNYGYAVVEKSDMVFIPDLDTALIDPFCHITTLSMTGNAMIIDNPENRPLAQYPRNIVLAAEKYMKDCGIADEMYILPEFEFYLFDQVGWSVQPNNNGVSLDAVQSYWNSDVQGQGVIVPKQKAYHIAKPYDVSYEMRSEMCMEIEKAGIEINYHHPEVAASGQFEIEPKLGLMSKMADATMMIKYIIKNVALKYGNDQTYNPIKWTLKKQVGDGAAATVGEAGISFDEVVELLEDESAKVPAGTSIANTVYTLSWEWAIGSEALDDANNMLDTALGMLAAGKDAAAVLAATGLTVDEDASVTGLAVKLSAAVVQVQD